MYRIVSNNSNFKVPTVRVGRKRWPAKGGRDINSRFLPLFRAQEKNAFGAWQDISPLLDRVEMHDWVVRESFISERLWDGEGVRYFRLEKISQRPKYEPLGCKLREKVVVTEQDDADIGAPIDIGVELWKILGRVTPRHKINEGYDDVPF